MSGWQPIETAPFDQEVLIFCPGEKPTVFTAEQDKFYQIGWQCSVEGRHAPADDFFGDTPKRPTHWMPLPEPPQPNKAPDGK